MNWDRKTEQEKTEDLFKLKEYYWENWPGISKYFNQDWFEVDFKEIVDHYTGAKNKDLSLVENALAWNNLTNRIFNKAAIKANLVKMSYEEKLIFWNDFELDLSAVVVYRYGLEEIETNVRPGSQEEKFLYVKYFWNRLKKHEYSKLKFDHELYIKVIETKLSKIKILTERNLFIELKLEELEKENDSPLPSVFFNDKITEGKKIAIDSLANDTNENYLIDLFDFDYIKSRIYGFVYQKKSIWLNAVKKGEIKIENVKDEVTAEEWGIIYYYKVEANTYPVPNYPTVVDAFKAIGELAKKSAQNIRLSYNECIKKKHLKNPTEKGKERLLKVKTYLQDTDTEAYQKIAEDTKNILF